MGLLNKIRKNNNTEKKEVNTSILPKKKLLNKNQEEPKEVNLKEASVAQEIQKVVNIQVLGKEDAAKIITEEEQENIALEVKECTPAEVNEKGEENETENIVENKEKPADKQEETIEQPKKTRRRRNKKTVEENEVESKESIVENISKINEILNKKSSLSHKECLDILFKDKEDEEFEALCEETERNLKAAEIPPDITPRGQIDLLAQLDRIQGDIVILRAKNKAKKDRLAKGIEMIKAASKGSNSDERKYNAINFACNYKVGDSTINLHEQLGILEYKDTMLSSFMTVLENKNKTLMLTSSSMKIENKVA